MNLKKLQLDNNIILKIEHVGHLVNLEWLDLSFNSIEKIEGLENLVKLTDLSLYSNKIKTLENMEKLVNLNFLSIGNNEILYYDQVFMLKSSILKFIFCFLVGTISEEIQQITSSHSNGKPYDERNGTRLQALFLRFFERFKIFRLFNCR